MLRTATLIAAMLLASPARSIAQADITISIVELWQRGDTVSAPYLELFTTASSADRCLAAHDSLTVHAWIVMIDSVYQCNMFGIYGPANTRIAIPPTAPEAQFLLQRGGQTDRYHFRRTPQHVSFHAQRSTFSKLSDQPDEPAPVGQWYGQSKDLIQPGMWLVECSGSWGYRAACPTFLDVLLSNIPGGGYLLSTYYRDTPPFLSSFAPLDSLTRADGAVLTPHDSAGVRQLHEMSEAITGLIRRSTGGLQIRLLSWKGSREYCRDGRCLNSEF